MKMNHDESSYLQCKSARRGTAYGMGIRALGLGGLWSGPKSENCTAQ